MFFSFTLKLASGRLPDRDFGSDRVFVFTGASSSIPEPAASNLNEYSSPGSRSKNVKVAHDPSSGAVAGLLKILPSAIGSECGWIICSCLASSSVIASASHRELLGDRDRWGLFHSPLSVASISKYLKPPACHRRSTLSEPTSWITT